MATEAAGACPVMLSPLAIRDVLLRNRTVFHHFTALGHSGGTPSNAHVATTRNERAAGSG